MWLSTMGMWIKLVREKKREREGWKTLHFIVVYVKIIRCAEDGDKRWEARRLRLSIHSVSSILSLMRPDNAEQIITLQEFTASCVTARKKRRRASLSLLANKCSLLIVNDRWKLEKKSILSQWKYTEIHYI